MGILKNSSVALPGNSGTVSGGFWHTAGIYVSPDRSSSRALMQLFPSQAAFVSGAPALYQTDYLLTGKANQLVLRNLANISEPAMIANVPDFSGGTFVSGV